MPTSINEQITDAVTQTNVKVLTEAPALAMGSIYQTMAHSTGLMMENAVAAQQQQMVLAQAATNMGIMQLFSVDTLALVEATGKAAKAAKGKDT